MLFSNLTIRKRYLQVLVSQEDKPHEGSDRASEVSRGGGE